MILQLNVCRKRCSNITPNKEACERELESLIDQVNKYNETNIDLILSQLIDKL